MCRLQVPAGKRIADRGPVRAFGHHRFDAVFLEEPLFMRDDNWRIVCQRNNPELHFADFGRFTSRRTASPASRQTRKEQRESCGAAAEEFAAAHWPRLRTEPLFWSF